ncbi:MAG: hypothetical protein QGD96_08410, partial [Anaerolineae bacterium]|nr:hypothetical protein [Anaerolineae bacterium]
TGGAARVYLSVNAEPLREDKLTKPMRSGAMFQPWRPEQAGTYTLQVFVTTSAGSTFESNIITVHVGGEQTAQIIPAEDETATATIIAQQSGPTATADQNANCRLGPSVDYGVSTSLLKDETAPITGSNPDRSWWVIGILGVADCWIWDGTVTVAGDTSGVPVISPPPLPKATDTQPAPLTAPNPASPSGTLNCGGVGGVTGGVTLNWSAVSNPNGIDHYEWALEGAGTESGSTGNTQASTSGLSCAGANYQWRVRAVDGKGNIGPWSGYLLFDVP